MKYNNTHIASDNIGDMRHRITIQTYSISRNAAGEEIVSWIDYATVWAAVDQKPGGSGEVEQADQTTGKVSAVFRIRKRSGLNEKMLVVWDGRKWNIRSILGDYDFTYQILECEHFYDAYPVGQGLVDDEGDLLIDDSGDELLDSQ